jgi:hypothetical protein
VRRTLAMLALMSALASPAWADTPERAPPSLLEPAKPLMDAYARDLDGGDPLHGEPLVA